MLEDDEDEETQEPHDTLGDDAAVVECPYCGETVEIVVDPGGGPDQEYVEDCEVCCRPWHVHVVIGVSGAARVTIEPEDPDSDGDGEDFADE